jgi:hypothetical protein
VDGVSTAVKVGGKDGLFVTGQGTSAVTWMSGRRIHVVTGPLDQAELLKIAESIEE